MAHNLVVVESPAKSKTIGKYLGSDYQVIATFGHIRDLPKGSLGVAIDNHFQPTYVVPKTAKKVVADLKKALINKQVLYIATDPDREGEAIGWHVTQVLELDKDQKPKARDGKPKVLRITFHEITKTAIKEALERPREIDLNLVDAQQARRVLDRLVGYTLSPFLWRKIYKGLSAGRVQSVALKLIVDRERERQQFKPVNYWTIQALLKPANNNNIEQFVADLVSHKGKRLDRLAIKSAEEGQAIIKELEQAKYQVANISSKSQKLYPKPPYITSTLQQDAHNKLGFSAKKTMALAQKLYESGFITYMRTDSTNLSSESISAVRRYIQSTFGQSYVPDKTIYYLTKSQNAQEAHEAIRPTDILSGSGRIAKELDASHAKLYEMIWRRTVACQMMPASFTRTTVSISANDYGLQANGSNMEFDGFLKVWGYELESEKELPSLEINEPLSLIQLTAEKHTTEPPPRYTEARLIKSMEELGVGRPSTYAPIIDTLFARHYIFSEAKQLVPEEVGFQVTDLLSAHFPEIVDAQFTAEMENNLDKIASGNKKWQPIIKEFWQPFAKKVEEKTRHVAKIKTDKDTDQICERCGKPMVEKVGRFGRFLACSGFPQCKNSQPIVTPTNLVCPRDGAELVVKTTKRRKSFFSCPNYPKCDFALWKKEDMAKKIEKLKKAGESLPNADQALQSVKDNFKSF